MPSISELTVWETSYLDKCLCYSQILCQFSLAVITLELAVVEKYVLSNDSVVFFLSLKVPFFFFQNKKVTGTGSSTDHQSICASWPYLWVDVICLCCFNSRKYWDWIWIINMTKSTSRPIAMKRESVLICRVVSQQSGLQRNTFPPHVV